MSVQVPGSWPPPIVLLVIAVHQQIGVTVDPHGAKELTVAAGGPVGALAGVLESLIQTLECPVTCGRPCRENGDVTTHVPNRLLAYSERTLSARPSGRAYSAAS